MLGKHYLCAVVTQEEYGKKLYGQQSANAHAEKTDALANADGPSFALDAKENTPSADATAQPKMGLNTSGETEFFTDDKSKHGQAAQVRPSTHGSRPESWGTPRTGIQAETHFSYDRGKHNIEEQAGA